ncbi:hypothetical protein H0H87_004009 [Tephrocybe sp. NHM501043]|nr:hypothetical protein H0H87_004009 [Tephrocybe sp. NHM501043]
MSGSDGKGKGRANVSPEEFDFEGIRKEERVWYFGVFLQRVQMMEAQGKLAYGEVLRSEDFLNGGVSGFGKVLRTVYRLLVALEETYPGIFVAPPGSNERREELLRELLETEQAHINVLNNVFDAASMLSDGLDVAEPCLESLLIDRSRLVQYHNQVIRYTEGLLKDTSGSTRWTEIFGLDDILDVILPTDDRGYNSLCEAVLRMDDISETMDEVGLQLRTMRSARILKGRAYVWTAPDPEDLGILLLDDCSMNSESKERYSLFFYESLLLCCTEGFDRRAAKPAEQVYPIYAWEMGPALRRTSPLDIVHAIPVSQLDSVYCPDSGVLSALESYVEDEDENGHLSSHPRPWSLIARKGPRSESSSFINQEPHDHFLQISPGVLSTLFNNNTPELDVLRSPSPLSLTHAVLSSDRPPTPPAEDGFGKIKVLVCVVRA